MDHRIRRAERYTDRSTEDEPPRPFVRAFYAAPDMPPPDGAYGASDLEGRPGALTSATELSGMRPVYDVSCPGCGRVFALDPDKQPITGEPGRGYDNRLTCPEIIRFRACCGWTGRLEAGAWVPIDGARQDPASG